ncbi:hypothetical protein AXG93_2852s1460 [Marchantia polymorpha subsp. ruderalis]|uniref:Uncharacterized protein n=1 Tax=Marchantia polymorpha subsp. ruderalis TaxID=1480154 RepID=A0A176WJU8_MARPO|nr:hypothetical protein AXG93_2852s1460 [Marchantia polymorpha subsp. ruderalis]
MEGADESIVSHAAETRGADSADEEPELPSNVQELLRLPEGKAESLQMLPSLTDPAVELVVDLLKWPRRQSSIANNRDEDSSRQTLVRSERG